MNPGLLGSDRLALSTLAESKGWAGASAATHFEVVLQAPQIPLQVGASLTMTRIEPVQKDFEASGK